EGGPPFIDAHNHLALKGSPGRTYFEAARSAMNVMGRLGISRLIIMPPPRVPGQPGAFDVFGLIPVVKKYPEQLACLGGGGKLDPMIHEKKNQGTVPKRTRRAFEKTALKILSKGAIGFGEFSVEHFSLNYGHVYESVNADHPLFFLLADIAAEHNVPIDIHMEAIPRDMALPQRHILLRSGRNPSMLRENISGFERLLSHNRGAKIIWAHAGWCNTGERTPGLCRELLSRHPNLYMSIKLSQEAVRDVQILTIDQNSIRSEWLEVFREFPDRFVIGTDQFYLPPGAGRMGPQKTITTRIFMNLLPEDLAHRIGIENPRRIFNLS
ncbi:MAG: amidohydrolase family protein, partial [Deltaproteobacteria bacterium]|nr:amidohydrolase family protein [Deltaproteobacteria bacterium]